MPGFNICGTGGSDTAVDVNSDIYRSYRWKISGLPVNRKNWGLVLDCTLPSIDFDILTVQGMSLEYKIPKKPSFPNIDMTFYDFGSLQNDFEEWTDKIWNPEKGLFDGGNTTDIKKTLKVEMLDHLGDATKTFEIYGAWPKKMSHSKLNMADESLKTLVVEFVYDYYTIVDPSSASNSSTPILSGGPTAAQLASAAATA